MVGETEWLAGGDVWSRGAEPQAVTPCRALDVCVEVGTGRPLTAVKAGANPSPSLSFRLNDAAFETGMCRTADIVLDLAAVQGWINARRNRPGCCSLLAGYLQANRRLLAGFDRAFRKERLWACCWCWAA